MFKILALYLTSFILILFHLSFYHFGIRETRSKMVVSTRSSNEPLPQPVTNHSSETSSDQIVQQLMFIISCFEALDAVAKVKSSGTQLDANPGTSTKGKGQEHNRGSCEIRRSCRVEDVDVDMDMP